MANEINDADIKALDVFGAFVTKKAVMKLNLNEVADLNGMLIDYNKVRKKLFDIIQESKKGAELLKVAPPPPETTPPAPPSDQDRGKKK